MCDCLGWFVKINFTKYVALVNDRALGFKLPLVSVNVLAVWYKPVLFLMCYKKMGKYSSEKGPKFLLENGVSNIIPEAHVPVGIRSGNLGP